ncbi:unnamed protein product [Caenorhabditis auriculariae]|uniref:C-type lectin domain-containing protein n=1 Tax=Caenorhabditis auriculariae TaxID=2777116 RepID=A0A8S1HGH6_9PELO|nr:unnamed protein product [Caenorhabditis auriculariae]
MNEISSFLVVALFFDAVADPHCPFSSTYFEPADVCLKEMYREDNFYVAESICELMGGQLPCVTSEGMNSFIANFPKDLYCAESSLPLWLGVYPNGGCTGGGSSQYSNYGNKTNQTKAVDPVLDCVFMNRSTQFWSHASCGDRAQFLCQLPVLKVNCPASWEFSLGGCYHVFHIKNGYPQSEALEYCVAIGKRFEVNATLASIHSEAENEIIFGLGQLTAYADIMWIGLQSSNNESLSWTDESAVDFNNLLSDGNNECSSDCCAVMNLGAQFLSPLNVSNGISRWNLVPCSKSTKASLFVCKVV